MPDSEEHWEALLRSSGCSKRVIAHCRSVRDLAIEYLHDNIMDREVLEAGALLHDIGRGITHGLPHAQAGADLCRRRGVPEEVARVVERHIGAGLTADECTLLGLLPIDCMPRTLEERVVAHADNRVAGTRRICLDERLLHAIHLQKRQKQRLYRLWQEMEMFRQTPGT